MTLDIKYRVVEKYAVTAMLNQPMHIGSAGGDKGEILVHPVDDVPFIQASGIAGVLRSYCESYCPYGTAEKYFGQIRRKEVDSEKEESEKDSESSNVLEESCGSRLRFSDGIFRRIGKENKPAVFLGRNGILLFDACHTGHGALPGVKITKGAVFFYAPDAGTLSCSRQKIDLFYLQYSAERNREETIDIGHGDQIFSLDLQRQGCDFPRRKRLYVFSFLHVRSILRA